MKKKIFIIIILLLTIFFIYIFKFRKNLDYNKNIEKNFFNIYKINYYSSANAISNSTNFQNPEWNIKIYQFTDVAIYLNRIEEVKDNNYIINMNISNFKFKDGQEVYYLNPNMFGDSNLNFDNLINNDLKYNVINTSNIDEQNYNIPIFFQDCSTPITLKFVKVLANNYKVSKDDVLVYNGSLIRRIGMNLNSIDTKLNFDIEIVTKDGVKHKKNIELDMPLKDDKRSILDGDYEKEELINIDI